MIGNYKPLIKNTISDVFNLPGITSGEFLYSVLRLLRKEGFDVNDASSILSIDDEVFYDCVCKIKNDIVE